MKALPWILVGVLSVALTVAICWIVFRGPGSAHEPTAEQALAVLLRHGMQKNIAEQFDAGQITEARIKARTIGNAVNTYYIDAGEYPPTLEALLVKNQLGKGPYLLSKNELLDPWGQPFRYDVHGARNTKAGATIVVPDIWTVAPNGKEVGNLTER